MPSRFHPLPRILLHSLGRYSRQEPLAQALSALTPPVHDLRQHGQGEPYCVAVPQKGLDLMMQCINPDAPEDQQLWGLHAVTWHTALSKPMSPWTGGWPEGLDVSSATSQDVVRLLAEKDDDAVLVLPTMTCFVVPGWDGQRWAVHGMLDTTHRTLRTLSLVRFGDWLEESS